MPNPENMTRREKRWTLVWILWSIGTFAFGVFAPKVQILNVISLILLAITAFATLVIGYASIVFDVRLKDRPKKSPKPTTNN